MNKGEATVNAGIAIDSWKLSIFERHLTQNGYKYQTVKLMDDVLMLKVYYPAENTVALAKVIDDANKEAARSKGARP